MSAAALRPAVKGDCLRIIELIQELADYEKIPDGPKIDAAVLEKDGFGDHPLFYCLVAELDKTLVGYAFYYYIYSTWEGKAMFLEDLYVQPEHRGKGIGVALMKKVAQVAVEENCCRFDFHVLNWNEPSIQFYKQRAGAFNFTQEGGFEIYRIKKENILKFAQS